MSDELNVDVENNEVDLSVVDQVVETVADEGEEVQAPLKENSDADQAEAQSEPEDEAIDLTGIEAAITTHTDQSDEDKRNQNRYAAKMRVQLKEKEQKLEELRRANAAGIDANDPKPVLTRYLEPKTVEANFQGSYELAKASYAEQLAAWEIRTKERHERSIAAIESQVAQDKEYLRLQDEFESKAAAVKGKIKDFDANIERAEQFLTVRTRDGQELDGTLIVKRHFAEDAPAILAAIGANKAIADKILMAKEPADVLIILSELRQKTKAALSSRKEVSRAQPVASVKGNASLDRAAIEKAMQKAADAADFELYAQYKKQLKGMKP